MLNSKRVKVSILAVFSLMALILTIFLVDLPEPENKAMAEPGDYS